MTRLTKDQEPEPRLRRLILVDVDMNRTTHVIDLTGVANANTTMPINALLEQRCDLGHWHRLAMYELPCWDD